ncbi:hypothetical protein M426DRAFT_326270 [Hypoxylon sp. CI-4A]|nr:hypothetical protein M426DRAFT_326270 [Hypoxylon sp. CI-4A]
MTRLLSWTSLFLLPLTTQIVSAGGSIIPPNNATFPFPTWTLLSTGSDARFRGLAPVSDRIAWVAGTNGTVLRTTDSGDTWKSVGPELSSSSSDEEEDDDDDEAAAAGGLEFRDIEAWSAEKAVVLSVGEGDSSRVYVTGDGGATWTLSFANREAAAFYDCVAFETPEHGMAMSDPVDGKMRLIETRDGGASWDVVDSRGMAPALDGEAGFAASGTCLATTAGRWYIASGGVDPGRIFRSNDGFHWDVSSASIAGGDGSGVFSV